MQLIPELIWEQEPEDNSDKPAIIIGNFNTGLLAIRTNKKIVVTEQQWKE